MYDPVQTQLLLILLTVFLSFSASLPRGDEVSLRDEIEFVKDRLGHDKRYAINFSKIKKELNWEPKISFEEGLQKTIEWYKANESWWKNIKSGEYQDYYNKQYNK